MDTTVAFQTRNGLSEDSRNRMNLLLNQRLADLIVLRGLAKQMHWNVKGPYFRALHETFDGAAQSLTDPIDDLAERAVSLGGLAEGTVRMASRNSDLADIDIRVTDGMETLTALADRWGEAANHMRDAIDKAGEANDEVSVDLFTEVTRILDQQLYFLESHLQ